MVTRLWTSVALAAISLGVSSVSAQAPNEPSSGLLLGAILDMSAASGDTPVAYNQRMGFSASSFGFSQTIPLNPYNATTGKGGEANATLVELTGTSASIFLNVYPNLPISSLQTSDFTPLGQQIAKYMAAPYNRQVFLNFAPEMNSGKWPMYGLQPTAYVQAWTTMANEVKRLAPGVALVWSPLAAEGYPYQWQLGNVQSPADQKLLDTNSNNQLDHGDDAYKAYYPGDSLVDWTGVSYYYQGPTYPLISNVAQPAGTIGGALTGQSVLQLYQIAWTYTNFYSTYCQTKPCMLSSSGAAFHSNTTLGAGPGQVAIQTAWFNDGIANATFLSAYPNLKMINMFEFAEPEDTMHDLRDYRLSNDDATRNALVAALPKQSYLLATSQPIPSDLSGTNPSGAGVHGAANTTGADASLPAQTKSPTIFSGAEAGKRVGMEWMALVTAVMVVAGLGVARP